MRLFHSCILSALFSAVVFGASTTAIVATVGGESNGNCSDTHADGRTASCHATSSAGTGDALSSVAQPQDGHYVWFGWLHGLRASPGLSIQSRARVAFSSEFAWLAFQGHGGIRITYATPTKGSVQEFASNPVEVYVNDGFGDYPLAGTLSGNNDSLDVPYGGYPIDIILQAATPISSASDSVPDYIALFRVKVLPY